MDPLLFIIILLFVGIGLSLLIAFIYEGSKITPPADKILSLVKGLDGFSVSYGPMTELTDNDLRKWEGYSVFDFVRKRKTYVYIRPFSENIAIEGDLEWMNKQEVFRLYSIIRKINHRRMEEYTAACKVETEARHARQREAAKEFYGSR